MIESSKDSIVDFLLEKNKDKSSIKEEEIRRSIQKLLHILLYQFCLQSLQIFHVQLELQIRH